MEKKLTVTVNDAGVITAENFGFYPHELIGVCEILRLELLQQYQISIRMPELPDKNTPENKK